MWTKKNARRLLCTECHRRLPAHADLCPECGYPAMPAAMPDKTAIERAPFAAYRLIRLLGGALLGAGIVAAIADSPTAATLAIMSGCLTYITGLLGSWWNSGD